VNIPEILIKGSPILNVDVKRTEDDVQPYTIFDSQTLEQSGATDVEEFLKQRLTMNTSFQTNSQVYAGFNGNTSSINLRGLGANETLVLVDGRRSAGVFTISGVGGLGQPDINGIPLSAIERIEVLPSSASAIYGGAAVGGVVNIILKKNFNGGDIAAKYENVTQGSAPLRTISGTYGFSLEGDTTHVMLSGHLSDGEPLTLGDRLALLQRGMSTIQRNVPGYFYAPGNPFPGASPNISSVDNVIVPVPAGTPGAFTPATGGYSIGDFGTTNADPDILIEFTPLTLKNGTPLHSPIRLFPRVPLRDPIYPPVFSRTPDSTT
jgi:iron complex outermembrane receptor protein